jgi:hypothetical protein
MGKAEKLQVVHKGAALQAQVARDHGLHLIEEQLLGDAAKVPEGVLQAVNHGAHVLAHIKPTPEQPRVAQDHQQRVPHTPGKLEAGEIDLRLSARRCLEADDGLWRRRRPDLPHECRELGVTPLVPGGANLREQPHGRQGGIGGQTRLDEGFIGVEFCRHRSARPVPHGLELEIAIELAVANPPVNRVSADAELPGERTLARALLQIVPQ